MNFELGRQQMERMMSRWVDGYIIMGSSMDIVDVHAYFQQGLPLVLCDWQENEAPEGIPQVSVDFYRAGQLAAHYLLDLGHRKLGVIFDEPQQTLRLEGFLSALEEAQIILPASMKQVSSSTLESGYLAAQHLLTQSEQPGAIFATTDWLALGAINAILDAGLRVPEDISVIGLDNIMLSAHLRPPLTSIAVPKLQLAREAVNRLFRQIDGEKDVPPRQLIEPFLIARQKNRK